jgi:hypothetical protein
MEIVASSLRKSSRLKPLPQIHACMPQLARGKRDYLRNQVRRTKIATTNTARNTP